MGEGLELPDEVTSELYRCSRCGLCLPACPTFAVKGSEGWGARGRLMICRALAEGSIEPYGGLLDRLFSCNSCMACEVACPAGVRVSEVLAAVRGALASSGQLPPGVAEVAKAIVERGNPWSKTRGGEGEAGKPILVFAGCVASELEPGVIKALEKLLEAAGAGYSVLEGPCCGFPLLRMGLVKEAKRAARSLAERIRALGPEVVITPCPGCARMLGREVRDLLGLYIRAEHASTYLRRLLREGRLVLKRRVELKATFHDPCVLGRSLGIYDAPRELLWHSGLALIEMRKNKRETSCCGYGQLNFMTYPDIARALAERRVEEALGTGADVLVTACPACLHALSGAAKEVARALAVADITEVLAELV